MRKPLTPDRNLYLLWPWDNISQFTRICETQARIRAAIRDIRNKTKGGVWRRLVENCRELRPRHVAVGKLVYICCLLLFVFLILTADEQRTLATNARTGFVLRFFGHSDRGLDRNVVHLQRRRRSAFQNLCANECENCPMHHGAKKNICQIQYVSEQHNPPFIPISKKF